MYVYVCFRYFLHSACMLGMLRVSSCGRVREQFKNLSYKNMTTAFFSCKCNYYVAVVWKETTVNTGFRKIRKRIRIYARSGVKGGEFFTTLED